MPKAGREMPEFDFAMLVLRLLLGVVFLAHGVKHVINKAKTIRWTASIGLRYPTVQWFFMAFAEIGIGLSMIGGLLTAVGAAGVIAMLFVAFWTVHRSAGFFVSARPDEGYEYVLVLSVVAAAIAILGPGRYSLDHVLGLDGSLAGWTGGLIALSGLGAAAIQLVLTYRRPNTD